MRVFSESFSVSKKFSVSVSFFCFKEQKIIFEMKPNAVPRLQKKVLRLGQLTRKKYLLLNH